MAFRFEFDAEHKILLMRFEGPLTDESLTDVYRAIRMYATATDANAGIWDFSSVTKFAVSSEFVRYIGRLEPVAPNLTRRRFIVVQHSLAYGLARMFQIIGEPRNRRLKVVYSLDEALTALSTPSPRFEPLELTDSSEPPRNDF
jgi:hypothetical protein